MSEIADEEGSLRAVIVTNIVKLSHSFKELQNQEKSIVEEESADDILDGLPTLCHLLSDALSAVNAFLGATKLRLANMEQQDLEEPLGLIEKTEGQLDRAALILDRMRNLGK